MNDRLVVLYWNCIGKIPISNNCIGIVLVSKRQYWSTLVCSSSRSLEFRAQNYSPGKKVDLRSPFSKVNSWPKLETQTIDRGDPNESRLLAEVTLSSLQLS